MTFPSEWTAAFYNSKLLHSFVKENEPPAIVGRIIIDGMLIVVSFLICWFSYVDVFFVKSTLIVVGILTGFVINALIFIGREGKTDLLTYEQALEFSKKIKFLLWTQIGTLKVFLVYIFLALIYLILSNKNCPVIVFALQTLLLWLLFFGLMRTLLLPLQIYDLHALNLDQLIQGKKQAVDVATAKHKEGQESNSMTR